MQRILQIAQTEKSRATIHRCNSLTLSFPGDKLEKGIDDYEGEKRKVLRRKWKKKTPCEMSTSGPGSEHDGGEELGDDDAPD